MSLTLTRRHNVDRFGYLIPTRYGNVPMVGAVATYRPGEGRFGGAVAVEEGTTNLEDPKTWSGWTISASVTALSTHEHELTASGTPAGSAFVYKTFNFGGSALTFQVEIAGVGSTIGKRVRWQASQAGFWGTELVLTAEYKRLIATIGPVEGNVPVGIVVVEGLSAGEKVKLRYRQVEQKPFATSFVDGTRAEGRLSYPKSLIAGLNALTVAAWTSGPPYWVVGNKYLVVAQTTGAVPYGDVFALLQRGGSNSISLWVRNDASSSSAEVAYDNVWDGNWHLIVGVINKSPQPGRRPIELYVDGELVVSSSNVNAVPDLSNIDETWGVQVGNWLGALQWNGLIAELLILPYAASEEEIRSWYEADGPLPPHPDALLQWDWQAVRPATMVAL